MGLLSGAGSLLRCNFDVALHAMALVNILNCLYINHRDLHELTKRGARCCDEEGTQEAC